MTRPTDEDRMSKARLRAPAGDERRQAMTDTTKAVVGELVAKAIEAARRRDGRGTMLDVRDALRGRRGDDAQIALAAVEELLDTGGAIRRLESEGEDAEAARLAAKFNDLLEWLEEMRDELLEPAVESTMARRIRLFGATPAERLAALADHETPDDEGASIPSIEEAARALILDFDSASRFTGAETPAWTTLRLAVEQAPTGAARTVTVDANDPDALERLIRESGLAEEMRVRLEDSPAPDETMLVVDGFYICSACLGQVAASIVGDLHAQYYRWEHVDAVEGADCADARGDLTVEAVYVTEALR